ncbi:MAG: hypothetical protein ACK5OB_06245 [Pirellula sp.]
MKRTVVFAASLLLGLVACLPRPSIKAQDSEAKQHIAVEEIGRSIVLVGRLGVPIGEKMELSGYWHFPETPHPKDASLRFSVIAVNGNSLKEPVEFNHEQIDVTDAQHRNVLPDFKDHQELENQAWTLTAYETGRIQITPDEYPSTSPIFPIAGMPYYTRPFTSQLVAVLKSRDGRIKR